jgi:pimeloyl-ACP methyl ester carboxylesterase
MRALTDAEFGPELFDRLTMYHQPQEIDIPALIIHDREDRVAPFEGGERLANDWPNAEFLPTEGLGHSRIIRDPEIITAATRFIVKGRK